MDLKFGDEEYSIFDGEVFSEEDYDSLEEQGEFDADVDDNDVILTENMIREFTNQYRNGKHDELVDKITGNLITKNKNRKVKRKQASQSRKINRSK